MIIRKELQTIESYKSGGLASKGIIKMSSNENPFGPSKGVLKSLRRISGGNLLSYPDSFHNELREYISSTEKIPKDSIFIGNGSEETIFVVIDSIVGKNEKVVFAEKGFSLYRIYTLSRGGIPVEVQRTTDFKHDLEKMAGAIDERTKLVIICNPDNPTGTYITHTELKKFLSSTPQNIGVLIDEAYIHYSTANDIAKPLDLLKEDPRLMITRTFSKAYGLASARIGVLFASPEFIEAFYKNRLPFNVGYIPQLLAVKALQDRKHLTRVINKTIEGREFLKRGMKNLGFTVFPSQTNFLMIRDPRDNSNLFEFLKERGILIRDLTSFGFPKGYYRITVGKSRHNKKLLKLMEEYVSSSNEH